MLESELAELFDCLVSGAPIRMKSNRSAFSAYGAVKASSARTELLIAAIPRSLVTSPSLDAATTLADKIMKFGARRNEIAHGRVFNLEEYGFCLAPNNINTTKWHSKGEKIGHAKYQYSAADIDYYAREFDKLHIECETLIDQIYVERSTQDGAGASE